MAHQSIPYDLDPVMVHKVEYYAHLLRRYLRLSEDDYQDYRQELYLHAIRSTPSYDPTKSGWAKYLEYVVHAQAINIMRRHKFRMSREIPMSFYIPTDSAFNAEDARATHLDGAPFPDDRAWVKSYPRGSETDSVDLSIAVTEALSSLAPHLQRIGQLLMAGYRPIDIAREFDMPYSSVYHQVKRVRQLLLAQGVDFLSEQVRHFARLIRKRGK